MMQRKESKDLAPGMKRTSFANPNQASLERYLTMTRKAQHTTSQAASTRHRNIFSTMPTVALSVLMRVSPFQTLPDA